MWTLEETEFLKRFYPKYGKQYCIDILGKTSGSVRSKASRLGLKSSIEGAARNSDASGHIKFLEASEYTQIDSYINNSTKILHRHNSCGHEWLVSPNNLQKLVGCPNCSKKGYRENAGTYRYLCYFPALDLYKVGVTVNWEKRKYDFGYPVQLIDLEKFSNGKEAYLEEKTLKEKLSEYMYNSGELKNGNTETFIWPN